MHFCSSTSERGFWDGSVGWRELMVLLGRDSEMGQIKSLEMFEIGSSFGFRGLVVGCNCLHLI